MYILEPVTPEQFEKYYRLRYLTLRQPWNQPEGSERTDDDATAIHAMLVDDNGEAIGVCRMHLQTPQEAQIRFMGVHENYQGKGLGKLLLDYLEDILMSKMVKQGLDATALDFSKEAYQSGAMVKKEIKVKAGIDKETSKKIMKLIKDSKAKVSAAIMDETIRVTGKKIDDLQEVIGILRANTEVIGMPLQYVNMKS